MENEKGEVRPDCSLPARAGRNVLAGIGTPPRIVKLLTASPSSDRLSVSLYLILAAMTVRQCNGHISLSRDLPSLLIIVLQPSLSCFSSVLPFVPSLLLALLAA